MPDSSEKSKSSERGWTQEEWDKRLSEIFEGSGKLVLRAPVQPHAANKYEVKFISKRKK